jgi:RNase adapter protein RapZ
VATKIVSFGFRHGDVPVWPAYVIDVRELGFRRNPFHDRKLRYMRGTDEAVQEDVKKTPDFQEKYEHLLQLVRLAGDVVYLGCTGGHHRSVTLTELLGKDLGIPVEHRDIDKR